MRSFAWLAIALALAGCTSSDAPRESDDPAGSELPAALALLEEWMTGISSIVALAPPDTAYSDILWQAARNWPERGPGLWLYIEQWAAVRHEMPYRQRVLHITALSDSTFRARTF